MGMFNNYIKEDKLELTNVNSRIDNVEEQQLSLSYIIDNLEIGGRNLLTGTQSGKDWVGYTSFENGEFYIDNPTGKSDVILSGSGKRKHPSVQPRRMILRQQRILPGGMGKTVPGLSVLRKNTSRWLTAGALNWAVLPGNILTVSTEKP